MSGFIVLLLFIGAVAMWFIGAYNGLVGKRIACDNAWSQIDIQLKRRHDLIPNLIETVKGYASHEKGTLEAVIAARNSAVQVAGQGAAAQGSAEGALTSTLNRLFALGEAYPDLKANTNFQSLQEELSSTENRIGFARQNYNDCVGLYKTAKQSFPTNFVANSFNFEDRAFFELGADEKVAVQAVPQVKF